jgi:hypothetical protein
LVRTSGHLSGQNISSFMRRVPLPLRIKSVTDNLVGNDHLRRLLTFEKLEGCLHDFLYSMDAARIEFHEYQFKPVLKFVNSSTEKAKEGQVKSRR